MVACGAVAALTAWLAEERDDPIMRILICEDDAETSGFIQRGLAELGHAVTHAADGEQALHLGAAQSFDAIILDRMLPQIDGIEILRRWPPAYPSMRIR